jgi:DNA-3-methyladenine glycosylase
LIHNTAAGSLSGTIVETEAYTGAEDPGSHAFRGPTPRNSVMFGPPGHAYVYRSYGIHACLNVVTDPEGVPGAVLIRALEPLRGIEIMTRNRGGKAGVELCNGPGKLCQALGIGLNLNGADLSNGPLCLEAGTVPERIERSSRIGLTQGADLPYRFYVAGSRYVSRGRPYVTQ